MAMKIGEKIKVLRKAKNISQETLANILGVTFQAVSKWETGATAPDIALIPPMASFFDVSIDELFDSTNHRVPTVEELKKDAERLLKSAIRFHKANPRCRFYMTATGPFKVICRYGILELECVFESWSCD